MPQDTSTSNNKFCKALFSELKKEIIFVAGLLVSFFIADYHFKVLITLLTEEWNLKLFHAVILTNIQEGSKKVTVIVVAIIADTFLGDCYMLLIAAIFYSGGLLIWYFTIPKPGDVRIAGDIFYLALLLIGVGQCGNSKYVESRKRDDEERRIQAAAANQEEETQGGGNGNNENEIDKGENKEVIIKKERKIIRFWMHARRLVSQGWRGYWIEILGTPIAMFAISRGNSQTLNLAIILLSTSAFFVVGKLSLHLFEKPKNNSLFQVFRVLLAALKKRHYDSTRNCKYYVDAKNDGINQDSELQNSSEPENNNVDYEVNNEQNSESQLNTRTFELGFLKKAALYNPSTENPANEHENWRLFTVKQVKETMHVLKAIRLSLVFLLYGVLTSVGDTFFIYQAFKMDRDINPFRSKMVYQRSLHSSVEVPIQVIAYGPSIIRELVRWLCHWVVGKQAKAQRKAFYGAVRVGVGMFLSIPCFVIAARVEKMREQQVISVYWLTPQLFLIGAMNGLAIDGIKDFFEQEMPEQIGKSYGELFAGGVVGIGQLLGCVWLVLWYSLVTRVEGSPAWFEENNINLIHLVRYYSYMAILGSISCCIYAFVAIRRYRRKSQVLRATSALRLETSDPPCA